MTLIDKLVAQFIVCFVLFALSCYVGDDDVVYELLDKKPTPRQARRRIRFVVLKLFVSCYLAGLLTIWIAMFVVRDLLHVHTSGSQPLLILVPCIAVAGVLAGGFQNIVRRAQHRKIRPLVDLAVLKSVVRQWRRFP